jgi:hypothetical protein
MSGRSTVHLWVHTVLVRTSASTSLGASSRGSGGVLVSSDYPVDPYGTFPALVLIGATAQLVENLLPRAIL